MGRVGQRPVVLRKRAALHEAHGSPTRTSETSSTATTAPSGAAAIPRKNGLNISAPSTRPPVTPASPTAPDHNRAHSTGVGPLSFNIIDRVRQSTALGYLEPKPPPTEPDHPAQLPRPRHHLRRQQGRGAAGHQRPGDVLGLRGGGNPMLGGSRHAPHHASCPGVGPVRTPHILSGFPSFRTCRALGGICGTTLIFPMCYVTKPDYPLDAPTPCVGGGHPSLHRHRLALRERHDRLHGQLRCQETESGPR